MGETWSRLDIVARSLAPALLTLVLIIAGVVRWPVPFVEAVGPSFPLISVAYWGVHRPDLLPASAVFGLGVFADLLGHAPLGVGVLVLLSAYGLIRTYAGLLRDAGFFVLWGVFVLVAPAAALWEWTLASLLVLQVVDPGPVIAGLVLTIVFYPGVALLFAGVQRWVFRSDRR